MSARIVVITEIISPYRIPVFNAAAKNAELDLHVIFLSETDPTLRQWRVYREEIQFSFEVLPSFRWRFGNSQLLLNRGLAGALKRGSPQGIVVGGYNYVASWQALAWAGKHKVPLLLWSESTGADLRGRAWPLEYAKKMFVKRSDAFLVPGVSAHKYLTELGVNANRIYLAPNAVDVAFFSNRAAVARQAEEQIRRHLSLPNRFFLYVGRLVREKGIFELIDAYDRLSKDVKGQVGLVFAGDGPEKEKLRARAAGERVRILGFLQREDLADVYALAEALVFPTHSDTWGLVVNEAMACGLPILAAEVAGCAADLVKDAWNGFVLPAGDVEKWCLAMTAIATDREQTLRMGRNSERRIQKYRPEDWAAGFTRIASTIGNL